jgi:hypothetical protein
MSAIPDEIKPTPEMVDLARQLISASAIHLAESRKGVPGQPDGANPVEAIGFSTQVIVAVGEEAAKFFKDHPS